MSSMLGQPPKATPVQRVLSTVARMLEAIYSPIAHRICTLLITAWNGIYVCMSFKFIKPLTISMSILVYPCAEAAAAALCMLSYVFSASVSLRVLQCV